MVRNVTSLDNNMYHVRLSSAPSDIPNISPGRYDHCGYSTCNMREVVQRGAKRWSLGWVGLEIAAWHCLAA